MQPQHATGPTPYLQPSALPRALVISTSAWSSTCCANLLQARGYQVDEAAGGSSWLRRVRTRRPELVVLVGELPGLAVSEVQHQLGEGAQVCQLPARLTAAAVQQLMASARATARA